MIELQLLKLMGVKQHYNEYIFLLNEDTLTLQSNVLLKDYLVYFELHPEHDEIDWGLFTVFFFQTRHPYLPQSDIENYKEIFRQLSELDVKAHEVQTVLAGFEQQIFYNTLKNNLDAGKDFKTVKNSVDKFQDKMDKIHKTDPLEEKYSLIEALESTDRAGGLQWRCKALREHFKGGILQGDMIIVAGAPGAGKTSFVASEITYMAEQLAEGEYIAWFNTEGEWRKIMPRVYCAALDKTDAQIRKWPHEAVKAYTKLMKGDPTRIKVIDSQRRSVYWVESIIKRKKPKFIVFDLLDDIVGFDKFVDSSGGGSTERFNRLYKWARQIATLYAPVIAITQLNKDGANSLYPKGDQLRGSAIDKQGAATHVITIGKHPSNNTVRYLSMPKEKNDLDANWHVAVQYDQSKSRYY